MKHWNWTKSGRAKNSLSQWMCTSFRELCFPGGNSKMHFWLSQYRDCSLIHAKRTYYKSQNNTKTWAWHSVVLRIVHVVHWSILNVAKMLLSLYIFISLSHSFDSWIPILWFSHFTDADKLNMFRIYSCLHTTRIDGNFRKLHSQQK